jgi:hypothetical protein
MIHRSARPEVSQTKTSFVDVVGVVSAVKGTSRQPTASASPDGYAVPQCGVLSHIYLNWPHLADRRDWPHQVWAEGLVDISETIWNFFGHDDPSFVGFFGCIFFSCSVAEPARKRKTAGVEPASGGD